MLARLLRAVVLGLIGLAALWCAWAITLGLRWPWLLLGLTLTLLPHAWLLAIEFVLLARCGADPTVPRATALDLLRAWWGEVGTASLVFGWRQPFAERREADVPGRPGRRGVVLVHGFVCNRGLWAPWLLRLRAEGVPAIAVTLEPVFGSIDDMLPIIDAAVARLQADTGQAPLIVAHSMGGLAVRAWLRTHAADERVGAVITIATPHHGTWLARLALSTNGRQMRRASRWLADLAAAEPASRRTRFICFYGHCDNIVFPVATARLDGAVNHHLRGSAHLAMVYRSEVFDETMRRLRD
jgi:triacylglycerol lipase